MPSWGAWKNLAMDLLAGALGWFLHLFGEIFAPSGWTLRRALALLLIAAIVSAVLFYVAWPGWFEDS